MAQRTQLELHSQGAAETQAAGAALALHMRPGQVIALHGELGAGKTTFVQGVALGLGVRSRVASPTFVLINEYTAGGVRLVHVDTYRLGAAAAGEAAAIGLEELLDAGDAVVAIEWAERVAALLPADHLLVELQYGAGEDERIIRMTATGEQSAQLIADREDADDPLS